MFFFKNQKQEEIDELCARLQGMSHLHETTASELHCLKSKYQELSDREVSENVLVFLNSFVL